MLEKEQGLELLRSLATDTRPYMDIRHLAQQVLDRCDRYTSEPGYVSDDVAPEDEVDMVVEG